MSLLNNPLSVILVPDLVRDKLRRGIQENEITKNLRIPRSSRGMTAVWLDPPVPGPDLALKIIIINVKV
jgi:hypothetical protein